MKKLLLILVLSGFGLQAQLEEFKDSTKKNCFLGVDIPICSIHANNSKSDIKSGNYRKSYDCGNDTVSGLLNVNFLSPELLGQQFYLFNNFIYWMNQRDGMGAWNGTDAAKAAKEAAANADPDNKFSGTGVFMINLGTSSYLQNMVAPGTTCPDGQTLLAAQLKYNNGNSLVTWSQDSMCLSPTDTFGINISKDQDNSVPAVTTTVDAQGIDWMKDNGPANNYSQAGDSPRKIRLVLKSGGSSAQPLSGTGAAKHRPIVVAKAVPLEAAPANS